MNNFSYDDLSRLWDASLEISKREWIDRILKLQAARATPAEPDAGAQDAARYRWLSKRVVITDGSTPGMMVITVVDDGVETTNEFLDEFTEPAIRALAHNGTGEAR